MNRFKVFLIVLVLISSKGFACLNWDIKRLKNKVEVYHDHKEYYVPRGHEFKIKDFPSLILDLEKGYEKTKDIDYLSDKGYVLIIQGKYEEALKLYLEIEKIKPNRYSTASNLGTTYELMGENEKAYEWIKKSIEINPKSHEESEWLHLKILEAKIKKIQNPTGEFFIGTNFGSEVLPKTKLSDEELTKLQDALFFQLNERISFIKPKDKIISVLLFELGNITLLNEAISDEASEIYELSKKYGFQNNLLNERLIICYKKMNEFSLRNNEELNKMASREQNLSDKLIKKARKNDNHFGKTILFSLAINVILLICSIVFFIKWRKLKKAATAS
ncbi:tetratricopeptide repeat protein [Flavobacterium artemisiae]|uniref:Tetratricopeptide repeat protein n=1 Tax=Flavobacterium artemisiae TaxID=2126556 RepID=A0ABW4HED8_9FLAO